MISKTVIENMELAMQRNTAGDFSLRISHISDAWHTTKDIRGIKSTVILPMIQLILRKLKKDWIATTLIKFTQFQSVKRGKQLKNGMMKR